jgi:hypothetical protein
VQKARQVNYLAIATELTGDEFLEMFVSDFFDLVGDFEEFRVDFFKSFGGEFVSEFEESVSKSVSA